MKTRTYSITPVWLKPIKGGEKISSIKLNINLERERFRITLRVKCTKVDFDSAMTSKKESVKQLRLEIYDYVEKAEHILSRLVNPSKETFTQLFKSATDLFINSKTDVYKVFDMKREMVLVEDRTGTAFYYLTSKRSFMEFKSIFFFEDIDVKLIESYKLWAKGKGNSMSTINMRLRCLRLMYNYAISEGFVCSDINPFLGLGLGATSKSKKVIYPEQLSMLYSSTFSDWVEERAKDYFFFLFLGNGMNFKDMAYLKRKDICGNTLRFIREKTKETSNEDLEVQVYLHTEMKRIIAKWGNKNLSPDSYLFPILPSSFISVVEAEHKRITMMGNINKTLHKVGKIIDIPFYLSLGLARHSFATTLKLNGTSVSFISEALGHSDLKTTMHYLKTLPDNRLKEMSESLMDFAQG